MSASWRRTERQKLGKREIYQKSSLSSFVTLFFFSFFPFSPFSFISFYFSLSLTSIGEFSLRFSSKQEEISHDSSFSIHFHVDVPSIVLVPLLADARSPDSIRRSSCSFTSSRCSDDGDPMLRATGSETILPSFLPSFLPRGNFAAVAFETSHSPSCES